VALVPDRGCSRSWEIRSGSAVLPADLDLPPHPAGLVLLCHSEAGRRLDPGERFLGHALVHAGLGTLHFDLLSEEEEALDHRTGRLRFDVPFLAGRLEAAIERAAFDPETEHLPIGLFGTGTAGAAALSVAGRWGEIVDAVVIRSGRPDLAQRSLRTVTADTLLIVGENDPWVLERNREALERMHGHRYLYVVAGASHRFEEPGTLDAAARAGVSWIRRAFLERRPPTPPAGSEVAREIRTKGGSP